MKRQYLKLLVIALLFLPALACGGSEDPTPIVVVVTSPPQGNQSPTEAVPPTAAPAEPAGGIQILEGTFAQGLTEEMQPANPTSDFTPDATVYLSLKIKGRPESGIVTARFYWLDSLIAEAGVDLADANSGLLFSFGEDTFAGYTLTHEQPFPLGGGYRADVSYNDQALGSYSFRIVPPADAIPSVISQVTLARGADENYNPVDPTTEFAPADTVFLVGHGDLGISTWLQADWYINGLLDEAGTRSLTLEENIADVGFSFSYLPEGGWSPGQHWVVLTVNGEEIGTYTFTIQ